jgi:phosphatidylglycerophosphate synthase
MRAPSLELWSNVHTLAVMLATALAFGFGQPAVLAAFAGISFAVLLLHGRRHWTPRGRFGLANAATTVRLLLTFALLIAHERLPQLALALGALCILSLDAIDGWLARRLGEASEFGARYDLEADALLVLSLGLLLHARGLAGAWVLIAGLWRYVYILARLVFPRPVEAPRTLFNRLTYTLMLAAFSVAWLVPKAWSVGLASLGTLGISVSFLRSFWFCYGPAARETQADAEKEPEKRWIRSGGR